MDALEFRADIARYGATTYVLSVAGELDLYVRPKLEQELEAVVRRGGRHLVVDLTLAEFLDSSIVGLLLHYLRELRGRGGELVLVSDDRRILRPFGILGFDRVFTIRARLADALAELPPAPGARPLGRNSDQPPAPAGVRLVLSERLL